MLTLNKNYSLILVVLFTMICAVAVSGDLHAVEPDYNTSGDWVNEYEGLEDNLTKADEDLKNANDSFNSANKSLNDSEVAFENAVKKLNNTLSNQEKSLNIKVSKYSAYKNSVKNYNTAKNNYLKVKNTYLELLKKYKKKKTKDLKTKVLKSKETALKLKKTALSNRNKKNSAKNAYIEATNDYYLSVFLTTQASSEVTAKNDIVNQNVRKFNDAEEVLWNAEDDQWYANFDFTNAEEVLNSINADFIVAMNDLYDQLLADRDIYDLSDFDVENWTDYYLDTNNLSSGPIYLADIFNESFYGNLTKIFEEENATNVGNETFINLAKASFLNNYTNVIMNDYFSNGYVDENISNGYIVDVINVTLPGEYNKAYNDFIENASFRANQSGVNATILAGQELINNITDVVNNLVNNVTAGQEKLAEINNTLGDLNKSAYNLNQTAADGNGSTIANIIALIADGLYSNIHENIDILDTQIVKLIELQDFINSSNTSAGSATTLGDIISAFNQAIGNATVINTGVTTTIPQINGIIGFANETLTNINNNVTELEAVGNETLNESTDLANLKGNLTSVDTSKDELLGIIESVGEINNELGEFLPVNDE
ncbi:MAG: hypothetical protein ISP01_08765 [Methanobrevibacter arboriphilus]|uniref:Adhesin-like protein n=1 Tax=Methanobrevibacter arboriphilus TaxID=39441 RepID=A0A843AQH0_METAZ|nr:hypothetical protein [Methanobrevibacter arboriphilus]MBF4469479.1 hypothetical protein [Methanobrevibacter arboriphilus]